MYENQRPKKKKKSHRYIVSKESDHSILVWSRAVRSRSYYIYNTTHHVVAIIESTQKDQHKK